jgi:small-conductance mechanosensitive channel
MRKSTGIRILLLLLVGAAAVLGMKWLLPSSGTGPMGAMSADLARALMTPYFHLGNLAVTPVFLVKSVLFLLVLGVVASLSRRFMQYRVLPRTSMDSGQQYAFARFTGYLVFVLGLMIGLQSAGVELSSLVMVGGALGIGVGFGLQTIASNFVAGLILLAERPVKLGDRVEVGDTFGDVVRIAGRSTWVRTNDNVVIIVPNSEFIENRVTNWTANDRQVRFSLPVGVSYGSDPEKVREILLEVARRHPDVMTDPPPEVLFVAFGDSSLDFVLRVWTIKQVQTPSILKSDLYFSIFRAFGEQGIEIPFPQRDLHLKSVSVPIMVSNVS